MQLFTVYLSNSIGYSFTVGVFTSFERAQKEADAAEAQANAGWEPDAPPSSDAYVTSTIIGVQLDEVRVAPMATHEG